MPQTFGEKLSFAAPVLLATLAVSVLIAFVLVWVVSGQIRTELKSTKDELTAKNDALAKDLSEEKKKTVDLQKKADDLAKANTDLAAKNETLTGDLNKAAIKLDTQGKALDKVSSTLSDFIKGQEELDSRQNTDLAKHDSKIQYIEKRLEVLKTLESDVNSLKDATGELKKDYVVLKKDLGDVSKKAEITDKDLTDLTERSRIFQLRVLAARAKEAADAARNNDIKSLVQKLNSGE
ncbi:MAG: hypothetical protein KIS92_11730 [Planctomycetota bacterium]|nr:hypothetical protein [Planctomycetota bacterium]